VRRECQLGIDLDAKTRDDGRRLDAESIKHDFGHGNISQPLARTDPGLMEFAGVDKAARSKMGVWKMQEWTMRHHCGKGGQCRRKKRVQVSSTETVLYCA